MKKIVLISAYNSSFIRRDIEALSEFYQVYFLNFVGIQKGLLPFIKQVWLIFQSVRKADLTFVWFADLRAFIAAVICKLLRKKMLVVVGGYELADHPEINYGAMITSFSRWRVKKIFTWVERVLVVDKSLKIESIERLKANPDKIEVVPTGYDRDLFKPKGKKEDFVLLVASAKEEQTLFVKGVYNYVEVARFMPEVKFKLVGISGKAVNLLKTNKPDNLEILGFMEQSELIYLMQKAKVYCQLSLREGLPNALCEAMLCNCIPVGTNVNGIPNAIGDTGFLVNHGNLSQTVDAINKALKKNTDNATGERITELFPKNKRTMKLKEIIEQL